MNLITLCMLPILLSNTYGYQNGAPSRTCDGMMPSHDGNVAQAGASSYNITTSATTYDCGDTVTGGWVNPEPILPEVNFRAFKAQNSFGVRFYIEFTLSGANFKGFLCQARPSVGTYTTVGTLTNTDDSVVTTNNCAGKAALTHTENSDKSSFQFSWTQSGTSTDTVYIVCTIVQIKSTFWVKQSSVAISYGGTATQCSSGADAQAVPLLLLCVSIIMNMVSRFL